MSNDLKAWLHKSALEMGFHALGIAKPQDADFSADLERYLEAGYHGTMTWLGARQEWRADPKALWPECKSIIMLAEKYPAPEGRAPKPCGEISAYARGHDYHDIVKKRLKKLGRELLEKAGGEIKVFVDTAPVMEKPLAALAGIGWQGKHGNLLSRELGNWFFLGAIFTTIELPKDAPATPHCGSCRACIDACPTGAFDSDGHLDARRCISYLTIEYDGAIPLEFRRPMGNLIYGCDICLDACPWNKFAEAACDNRLAHREENRAPKLDQLLCLDETAFRNWFYASPVKRIGWARFMRNCLIAAGNSGDTSLLDKIEPFLTVENEMLQETAEWAQEELCQSF